MTKTLTNFRLSEEGLTALDKIAAHFGLSRTATIEFVMREVAKRDMLVSFSLAKPAEVLDAAGAVVQEAHHHQGNTIAGIKAQKIPKALQEKIDTLEQATTVKSLHRDRVVPLPKPGKNKDNK